jgi:hypothetical protein
VPAVVPGCELMELPVFTPEERGLGPSFATPEGGVRTLETTVGKSGLGRVYGRRSAGAGTEGDGGDRTGLLGVLLRLPKLDAVVKEAEAGYLVLGMSGGGRLNAGSDVAAGRRDAKLGPPSMISRVRTECWIVVGSSAPDLSPTILTVVDTEDGCLTACHQR